MAKKIGRGIFYFLIILGILAGAAALLGPPIIKSKAKKSFPQVEGEIQIPGLDGEVRIYRDAYGVPQIYATSHHDLFFAQGYVHAQDRFWQMDFWRHLGAGRLAEMLGKPMLETDRFLRTLARSYVRQVLTAGGRDQPVLDKGSGNNSVFTTVLIQALNGEADANSDGYITAEELNFFVRQRVYANVTDIVRGDPIYRNIEQTPQYGKWSGEGEFIFMSPPNQ